MNIDLQMLKESVERWVDTACQRELLSNNFAEKIDQFNARTPASLFDVTERPLVVGFFGGTGVGKSTLLNRLAGEDISKTGVERPTSREVTLYLHSTVQIDHLPKEYPIGQIKSAFHNNNANREILWIDMPDFDSVESDNRHLVYDWLPYIDTLVYVVSPERYRDDNGWRLLLQHGGKHAWVFVINHWDRGTPAQREDFRSLLAEAGLDDPHLFCTDSGPDPKADEFESLKNFIQSLSSANTIAQLEARGILMRVRELESVVEQGVNKLGSTDLFKQAKSEWDTFWQNESASVLASVHWKYPFLTAHYANSEVGLFKSIWLKVTGREVATQNENTESGSKTDSPSAELIQAELTQALFENEQTGSIIDDINELVQISARKSLPAMALRSALQPISAELETRLNNMVSLARDTALKDPGSPTQRFLTRTFSVLSTLLPVLAVSWAGYRIVNAFYVGGSQPAQYLGSNFAINAALLVGLSWLLPYFLARKIKPSLQRVATQAMQQGAAQAMQAIQQEVHAAMDKVCEETQVCITEGRSLFDQAPTNEPDPVSQDLQRTLIQPVN